MKPNSDLVGLNQLPRNIEKTSTLSLPSKKKKKKEKKTSLTFGSWNNSYVVCSVHEEVIWF